MLKTTLKSIGDAVGEAFGAGLREGLAQGLAIVVVLAINLMFGLAALTIELLFALYKFIKKEAFGRLSLWFLRIVVLLYFVYFVYAFVSLMPTFRYFDLNTWVLFLAVPLILLLVHLFLVEDYAEGSLKARRLTAYKRTARSQQPSPNKPSKRK